jgi:hypothetical protein
MYKFCSIILFLLPIRALSLQASPSVLTPHDIFTFEPALTAENLVTTLDGSIIATTNDAPEIYKITPLLDGSNTTTSQLLHSFNQDGNYNSCWGVVEGIIDVFYTLCGVASLTPPFSGTKGSWSLFSVDLRTSNVIVTKIMDVPDAVFVDGMVLLSLEASLIATGDLQTGSIIVIDYKLRTSWVAVSDAALSPAIDPIFDPDPALSAFLSIGINGLKLRGTRLYWTNTSQFTLGYIIMDLSSGHAIGPPVIAANYSVFLDDFNIDDLGNFYLTQVDRGIIFRPFSEPDGSTALSEFLIDLNGANACAFGASLTDLDTLYILSAAADGTFGSGSKIDKVNLSDILATAGKV